MRFIQKILNFVVTLDNIEMIMIRQICMADTFHLKKNYRDEFDAFELARYSRKPSIRYFTIYIPFIANYISFFIVVLHASYSTRMDEI